jgi:hypothetical protein
MCCFRWGVDPVSTKWGAQIRLATDASLEIALQVRQLLDFARHDGSFCAVMLAVRNAHGPLPYIPHSDVTAFRNGHMSSVG